MLLQIINALHLPFELAAGYIGDFKIEGLLGAVAGSPLTLVISDVCLVLKRKDVDWDNELMFRYTKEMMIALLQSFSSPSYEKKKTDTTNKKSFISPAKWILVRESLCSAVGMLLKKAAMHCTCFKCSGFHRVRFKQRLRTRQSNWSAFTFALRFASIHTTCLAFGMAEMKSSHVSVSVVL